LRDREALDEIIRVKARRARERNDVAGLRVERHHRAALAGQGLLGDLLHAQIHAEHQIVARDRRPGFQVRRIFADPVDRAARRIHEYFAKPRLAVQLRLVGALDAQLADQARARIFGAVDALEVLVIDGAHIADGVNTHFLQRIMPREARMDVHAGELEAMHGEARHLLLVHLQLDGNAFVYLVRLDDAVNGVHLFRPQHSDADQLSERRIDRLHGADLFAHELEIEGRRIVGEHQPVTIEDQPTARWNRLGADAVALRQLGVILISHDLQVEEPPRNGEQQHGSQDAGDDAADSE
jgi:hypothetical protein